MLSVWRNESRKWIKGILKCKSTVKDASKGVMYILKSNQLIWSLLMFQTLDSLDPDTISYRQPRKQTKPNKNQVWTETREDDTLKENSSGLLDGLLYYGSFAPPFINILPKLNILSRLTTQFWFYTLVIKLQKHHRRFSALFLVKFSKLRERKV